MGIEEPAATHAASSSARSTGLGLRTAKTQALAAFERAYLVNAIRDSDGNVSLAAQRAGKERRSFGKLRKKYGIDKQHFVR